MEILASIGLSARAVVATLVGFALGTACTSFGAGTEEPSPLLGPAMVEGNGVDAAAPLDASPGCAPITLSETFETANPPPSWEPLLANEGHVNFSPNAMSPPLSLHAFGTFSVATTSRALLRTKRAALGVRGDVDLDYLVTFDQLLSDARLDVGCSLELQRADTASMRARVSAGFGMPGEASGLLATVDVLENASSESMPLAPPSQVLSPELTTVSWYRVHVHAVVGAANVKVDFGTTLPAGDAVANAVDVAFAGADSIVVSCGVDNATSNPSGAGSAFSVRIDDVALRACP